MEEIEAGLGKIYQAFGFSAILDSLAKGDFEKEDYIKQLSVYRVYGKIQYNAHVANFQRKYQELLNQQR